MAEQKQAPYVYQAFPKHVYHKDYAKQDVTHDDPRVAAQKVQERDRKFVKEVASQEELDALDSNVWRESPAAFEDHPDFVAPAVEDAKPKDAKPKKDAK